MKKLGYAAPLIAPACLLLFCYWLSQSADEIRCLEQQVKSQDATAARWDETIGLLREENQRLEAELEKFRAAGLPLNLRGWTAVLVYHYEDSSLINRGIEQAHLEQIGKTLTENGVKVVDNRHGMPKLAGRYLQVTVDIGTEGENEAVDLIIDATIDLRNGDESDQVTTERVRANGGSSLNVNGLIQDLLNDPQLKRQPDDAP